jgi:hypothetical protein
LNSLAFAVRQKLEEVVRMAGKALGERIVRTSAKRTRLEYFLEGYN